jgi:hypothetical protein
MQKYLCPHCQKQVKASHFSCHAGARIARLTGPSKARGTAEYYRAIQLKAAATRKRNNKLRKRQGLPVL